ncbi:AraC family transcriptional regulator [Afipia sp. TerB]
MLTHIGIGDFSLSVGSFSVGIRAQRTASDDKLIVGMLLSAAQRVMHWSYDMDPGDVLVIPPTLEHDGRFFGASSYAAMRFDLADVASLFPGEPRLGDPAMWTEKNRFKADARIGAMTPRQLNKIVMRLVAQGQRLPPDVADFWRRSIIDAFTASIVHALPPDDRGWVSSAERLVRDVEAYVDANGARPVHISEICAQFGVSRRSLHRAFDEILGMGPVTFLRQKRLCAIHSVLRHDREGAITIGEVAMRHGFVELGRFSHYYRSMFDEYPSETLRPSRLIRRDNHAGAPISLRR